MLYIIYKQWDEANGFIDLMSTKMLSKLINESLFNILFQINLTSFNICIDFYYWPSKPKFVKNKTQLNDEFDYAT